MGFIPFLKQIFLDEKKRLSLFRANRRDLPPAMYAKIEEKNAVANVKRIVPFSALIFLIEVLNQLTIILTNAYPELRVLYAAAGVAMLLLTGGAVLLAFRALSAPVVSARRCRLLYRAFWLLFTLGMLAFICLELRSRGLTNNFFYLLILTASFPLLSWGEALFLFGIDVAIIFPAAICTGFTPQQLLQLPLITVFALVLSRILYNSRRMNDIVLEQLAQTNRKLAALAQTDPLTGLLNRRGIREQLQETLSQLARPARVAFLMIDIDLFKNYNDRFGHEQGDQCLKKVAGAVQRCVHGPNDFASRFGGEEFLVALVGCETGAALRCAQCLRQSVMDLALDAASDAVHRYVTVSIGVADAGTPIDFTALYEQADQALYRAKNAGRNCVAAGNELFRGDAKP